MKAYWTIDLQAAPQHPRIPMVGSRYRLHNRGTGGQGSRGKSQCTVRDECQWPTSAGERADSNECGEGEVPGHCVNFAG